MYSTVPSGDLAHVPSKCFIIDVVMLFFFEEEEAAS